MPNRILRDWTDSDRFDGLSPEAERLFVRLIMKADDYGRFHSETRRVKAACFPLLPTLRENDVARWLEELSSPGHQLVLLYEAEGRKLLAIPRFGQRLKQSRPKFPPPPGEDWEWMPDSGNFPPLPGSSGKFRLETDTDTETETETKKARAAPVVFDLPADLRTEALQAAWGSFAEHRRAMKAPLTKRAAELIFRELRKLGPSAAVLALEQSIASGWRGVFPVKPNHGKTFDKTAHDKAIDEARQKSAAERAEWARREVAVNQYLLDSSEAELLAQYRAETGKETTSGSAAFRAWVWARIEKNGAA